MIECVYVFIELIQLCSRVQGYLAEFLRDNDFILLDD